MRALAPVLLRHSIVAAAVSTPALIHSIAASAGTSARTASFAKTAHANAPLARPNAAAVAWTSWVTPIIAALVA